MKTRFPLLGLSVAAVVVVLLAAIAAPAAADAAPVRQDPAPATVEGEEIVDILLDAIDAALDEGETVEDEDTPRPPPAMGDITGQVTAPTTNADPPTGGDSVPDFSAPADKTSYRCWAAAMSGLGGRADCDPRVLPALPRNHRRTAGCSVASRRLSPAKPRDARSAWPLRSPPPPANTPAAPNGAGRECRHGSSALPGWPG